MTRKNVVTRTDNLCKNFREIQTVRDLNLRVYLGSRFGLLCRNGVGKIMIEVCHLLFGTIIHLTSPYTVKF